MQFSLREFLTIAGVASVGTASLLYASPWVVSLWIAVIGVLIARAAVRVFVLSGARRAGAIGFLVFAVLYGGAVLWRPNTEFNPWTGVLPTTKAALGPYLWVKSSRSYFVDPAGNRYKQAPDGATVVSSFETGFGSGFGGGGGGSVSRLIQSGALVVRSTGGMSNENFLSVAHCLWTLLFGYLGGKYAVWVYTRRQQEETA